MEDLSEAGGEVLHSWIDKCEQKINEHARKSTRHQGFAITLRTLLVIVAASAGTVALVRAFMLNTKLDFYYSIVLYSEALIFIFMNGMASMDKSTFHLRLMHELTFMKFKCRFMLTERRSPEIIREEYQALMTKSNKLMYVFN